MLVSSYTLAVTSEGEHDLIFNRCSQHAFKRITICHVLLQESNELLI